jgi:hypothetical protein
MLLELAGIIMRRGGPALASTKIVLQICALLVRDALPLMPPPMPPPMPPVPPVPPLGCVALSVANRAASSLTRKVHVGVGVKAEDLGAVDLGELLDIVPVLQVLVQVPELARQVERGDSSSRAVHDRRCPELVGVLELGPHAADVPREGCAVQHRDPALVRGVDFHLPRALDQQDVRNLVVASVTAQLHGAVHDADHLGVADRGLEVVQREPRRALLEDLLEDLLKDSRVRGRSLFRDLLRVLHQRLVDVEFRKQAVVAEAC